MARRMDNYIRYLMVAGKKTLEDAKLTSEVLESLNKSRCGILIGSAMGGMQVRFLSFLFSVFSFASQQCSCRFKLLLSNLLAASLLLFLIFEGCMS